MGSLTEMSSYGCALGTVFQPATKSASRRSRPVTKEHPADHANDQEVRNEEERQLQSRGNTGNLNPAGLQVGFVARRKNSQLIELYEVLDPVGDDSDKHRRQQPGRLKRSTQSRPRTKQDAGESRSV